MSSKRVRNISFALLTCAYIIFAVIYVANTYNHVIQTYKQQLADTANNLELFLNGRLHAVQVLAQQPEIAGLDPKTTRPRLVRFTETFALSNAALFDHNGIFIASVDTHHPPRVNDYASFDAALRGNPVISNRILRKGFDYPFISIRVAVTNEQHHPVGVLAAGVSGKDIAMVIGQPTAPGMHLEYMLVDGNQELLYHQHLHQMLPFENNIKTLIRQALQQEDGLSRIQWPETQTEEMVWFSPIRYTNWRLIGTIPVPTVYTTVASQALAGISAASLAVVCLALFLYLFYKIKKHKLEMDQQRLEHLAIINQLAAGIAHEIRNPLTSIKGFIQYSMIKHALNEDHMATVLAEIDRIEDLTNEFRLLTRPQEPRSMKLVNLTSTINASVMLLQSQALDKCLSLSCDIGAEQYHIYGDINLLKQLWLNLIKNAIEAVPYSGKVKIQLIKSTAGIMVQIEDNGEGISPEHLKQLGTPFYTTKEYGTGLGLSVSYNIIHQHKGRIEFASEPGKGTTVTVTFPLADDPSF